jgi:hypothetical protein
VVEWWLIKFFLRGSSAIGAAIAAFRVGRGISIDSRVGVTHLFMGGILALETRVGFGSPFWIAWALDLGQLDRWRGRPPDSSCYRSFYSLLIDGRCDHSFVS